MNEGVSESIVRTFWCWELRSDFDVYWHMGGR